jgi:hypothetical protein
MAIHGIARSDENVVTWKINENATDKSGIPTILSCGIIVLHQLVEFNADVELKCSAAKGHVVVQR